MVSETYIRNIMHQIWLECHYNGTLAAEWMYQALEWYINSGRASTEFLRELVNLSDPQIRHLVFRCGRSTNSTDGYIRKIRSFLSMEREG